MNQEEYDDSTLDQNSDQKPSEGVTEQATTDAEALARDRKRALDEEAVEAEHLDYFMAHVSGQG